MTKIITAVVLYRSGCHASPGSVISDWIRERDDGCAVWNLEFGSLGFICNLAFGAWNSIIFHKQRTLLNSLKYVFG